LRVGFGLSWPVELESENRLICPLTRHHPIRFSRKTFGHTFGAGKGGLLLSAAQLARSTLFAAIYELRQNDMQDRRLRAKSSRWIFYCGLFLSGAFNNRQKYSELASQRSTLTRPTAFLLSWSSANQPIGQIAPKWCKYHSFLRLHDLRIAARVPEPLYLKNWILPPIGRAGIHCEHQS